jgi:Holliday junction resolvase RusA-like endonuclease
MDEISLLVIGEPASKSNSRRLINRGGKPMFIKSQKALDYEAAAIPQIKVQMNKHRWQTIEKPCCLEAEIFYASRRPDLDESLIMDVLEKAGVYTNDRLIEEKHIYKHLDKENPRSVITVYEIEQAM